MQPEHHKNIHAAELVSRGGQKRMEQLNAAERSALARHAARARWHPRESPGNTRTSPGDHPVRQTGIKRRQLTLTTLLIGLHNSIMSNTETTELQSTNSAK